MQVIERNIKTGKTRKRPYNQKELDNIAVMETESAAKKVIRDKRVDIDTKREAAIEEVLMSGTSPEALAYRDAIK